MLAVLWNAESAILTTQPGMSHVYKLLNFKIKHKGDPFVSEKNHSLPKTQWPSAQNELPHWHCQTPTDRINPWEMPPNPIRPFLRNALYSFSSCSRAILVHHPQPQPHEPILKISRNSCFQTAQHRNYISEMRKLAFEGNIIRLLRNEIQYELERSPPTQVFLLTHFL